MFQERPYIYGCFPGLCCSGMGSGMGKDFQIHLLLFSITDIVYSYLFFPLYDFLVFGSTVDYCALLPLRSEGRWEFRYEIG